MVKFFERDGKYNWVDEYNVVVGFSATSCCCEQYGYFYSLVPKPSETDFQWDTLSETELKDYHFVPEFYESNWTSENGNEQEGIFKMINSAGETIYLTIFNYHNGYYAHGFEMLENGVEIRSGYL